MTTRNVRASLAMLSDAQAEVITLSYYGQLSHTEIAAYLGLPTVTVKGRMRLGLQRLQADIETAARLDVSKAPSRDPRLLTASTYLRRMYWGVHVRF